MRHPAKRMPVKAVAISLEDVQKIFERLLAHVDAEGTKELAKIGKPDGKSTEDFASEMADLKARAFRITVTVGGRDGESLYGDEVGVFRSPNLPNHISYVYMTNIVAFEGVANNRPTNQFELNLDFSKPPLLDANTFVSSPTSNNSNLRIEGDNDAWVSAVYDAVDGVLRHRRTRRTWIHKGFAYDAGLFFLGFPIAFWVCARVSPTVSSVAGGIHDVVSAGVYVYIVLVVTWAYRALFGYTKWAFPTVELVDNKDNAGRHRLFWGAIILAILGNFAWELLKQAR